MDISIDFHFFKNLYYRFQRGLGCCDLTNYDDYISEKIASDLRTYKKKNFSYPMDMTVEEWDNTIQEIINGLEAVAKIDTNDKDWCKLEGKALKKRNKAMRLFAKHLSDFWF